MNYSTLISAQDLLANIDRTDWVVLDARFDLMKPEAGRQAYQEGHITGARYADLETDLSGPVTEMSSRHPLPDPETMARRFGEWGIDKNTQVVVYNEQGGLMAARPWWLLKWLGHGNAAFLDGGLEAWQAAGGTISKEPPVITPRKFTGNANADMVLTTDDIIANLDSRERLLIDVRAADRFTGEKETIHPVAGHIPGAVNVPLSENMDSNGFLKTPDQLRTQYEAVFGNYAPEQVALMCGSGVTACHTLLALTHAGISGPKVYSGSWSEWIRDPARPIVKG